MAGSQLGMASDLKTAVDAVIVLATVVAVVI